jgi:hypothetical protein
MPKILIPDIRENECICMLQFSKPASMHSTKWLHYLSLTLAARFNPCHVAILLGMYE